MKGSEGPSIGEAAMKAMLSLAGVSAGPEHPNAPQSQGLVAYARALYQAGYPDYATMMLVLSTATDDDDSEDSRQALQLAEEHSSAARWALGVRSVLSQTSAGHPLDAAAYEVALRKITDDRCSATQVEPLIAVGRGVARFASGDREGAAHALDEVLSKAERDGLIVPRVDYKLEQPLSTGKAVLVSVHMTAAQGFISENSMSVAAEVLLNRKAKGLTIEAQTNQNEDAARTYVHVASTAATYHLLQGHDGAGAGDAERALDALRDGVRLGSVLVARTSNRKWVTDSEDELGVLSELALQRHQPLLAADVLRELAMARSPDSDKADALSLSSVGLRAVGDIEPLAKSARVWVHEARQARRCEQQRKPAAVAEATNCDQLRRAIAWWKAGFTSIPPRIRPEIASTCSDDVLVLDVLRVFAAKPKAGWPNGFEHRLARAAGRSTDSGYVHDAIALIRQAQTAGLCAPELADVSRRLARRAQATARDRVDALTYALGCASHGADAQIWDDLMRLGEAAARLPDPAHTHRVDAAIVRFMVVQEAWGRLVEFASSAAFIRQMEVGGPSGGATALLIEHAAAVLAGNKPDLAVTRDRYDAACVLFGDTGREALCRELGHFRNRSAMESVSSLAETARRLLTTIAQP